MKQKSIKFKYFDRSLFLLLFVFITNACSLNEEKDILFVRDNYHAETTPYENKIQFTLTTNDMVKGIDEPIKINTIHDTNVYVREVRERENELKGKKEILIIVGFDSHFSSKSGTMLSLFKLNNDDTYSRDVKLRAFNEKGELGDFGYGSGDGEGRFQQNVHYVFEKEELIKSKEWTFEISGLYLLNYNEK